MFTTLYLTISIMYRNVTYHMTPSKNQKLNLKAYCEKSEKNKTKKPNLYFGGQAIKPD